MDNRAALSSPPRGARAAAERPEGAGEAPPFKQTPARASTRPTSQTIPCAIRPSAASASRAAASVGHGGSRGTRVSPKAMEKARTSAGQDLTVARGPEIRRARRHARRGQDADRARGGTRERRRLAPRAPRVRRRRRRPGRRRRDPRRRRRAAAAAAGASGLAHDLLPTKKRPSRRSQSALSGRRAWRTDAAAARARARAARFHRWPRRPIRELRRERDADRRLPRARERRAPAEEFRRLRARRPAASDRPRRRAQPHREKVDIGEARLPPRLPIFFDALRETEESSRSSRAASSTSMSARAGVDALPVVPRRSARTSAALNTRPR